MRLLLALRCFFSILFSRRLPAEALALSPPSEPPALPPPPAVDAGALRREGALQLLGLLQREGRLVDFLEEDIGSYTDAQIGAAVRDIHKGCRRAISEHVPLQPVLAQPDGASVRIEPGFSPARIRLVGNVVGAPPFTGTLRHPGWWSERVALPSVTADHDPTVIAPAEVELG